MRTLLLRTSDPLVERRAERVAALHELEPVVLREAPAAAPGGEAAGLLVQLELDGAVDAIRQWRERWGEITIVAYLSQPSPELWEQAEQAGADEVTTRGRADRVLAEQLTDRLSGRRRARRLRLAPMAEFAGRLGYVGRIQETPVGSIALFHIEGQLRAVSDECPHAGASLAEGELEGDVVTCPRHGSQFCVTDGRRLRGPADVGVRAFPVIVDSGVAFLELPR
ncbi:MAG TPA: Rieske 2Fe-2S domain-containing protein [Solirubrobacteraceae bacterium]|nr:Rieske 2Fe-2S domain-containing protein [Solirubrobacteraceae bacterium]